MNHLLFVAILSARTQVEAGHTPSEAEVFEARGRTQRKGRFVAMVRRLAPAALVDRIAARRGAKQMQAEAARLESLSPHLLDDIGVIRQGAEGYIIVTDEDERLALKAAPARTQPAATPEAAPDPAPVMVRTVSDARVAPPVRRHRTGAARFA